MPDIQISMAAIVVAVAVAFLFGFVWYTMIFGKVWAVEMGFDPQEQPKKTEIIRGMLLMVLENFFLA